MNEIQKQEKRQLECLIKYYQDVYAVTHNECTREKLDRFREYYNEEFGRKEVSQ